ncbi:unnamed protein product [Phyllotreta striolata]|uniref:Uncharacterized protein n=1 Tax=Phyllotreta striolata TaxID=444603 RepID=A0A9P0DV96_PHYSR|nr:unnamed protein product [Phyllotreta striolata]
MPSLESIPPAVSSPNAVNLTDPGGDAWSLLDELESPLPLDASEGGFFSGNFVPPPPRPLFLDDSATPDGPTTCDLCTWSWQHHSGGYSLDMSKEAQGLGWVLTLVIVSLSSAIIGAIVMIIVLHCKRLKSTTIDETERGVTLQHQRVNQRPPISTPDDKNISAITPTTFPNLPTIQNATNTGVWSWLSRRNTCSIDTPTASPAENHYTHMDDGYNGVGEALYAELDADEAPAYRNSGYADAEAPASSAPSSAYYSDLSTTTVPERAYEVVGLATAPAWEAGGGEWRRPAPRLAAIRESGAVPSDYV